MKRLLTALFLTCLLMGTVYGQKTFKTSIHWNENKARILALKHLEEDVDVTLFQGVDPNFRENIQTQDLQNDTTKIAHRKITFFSGGEYSVAYDGENIVNYYRSNGDLEKVSVCSTPFGESFDYGSYPRKCVEYGYPKGKIMSVSLDVSPNESYVFLPNGQLKDHWIGNNDFDGKGHERWKRQ